MYEPVTTLAAASGNDVAPGTLGFLVVFGMAVLLFFLFRSMSKHLRKVNAAAVARDQAADARAAGSQAAGSAAGNGKADATSARPGAAGSGAAGSGTAGSGGAGAGSGDRGGGS